MPNADDLVGVFQVFFGDSRRVHPLVMFCFWRQHKELLVSFYFGSLTIDGKVGMDAMV